MALSADTRYVTKSPEQVVTDIVSGATIYVGALLMADSDTGGAAEPYDGNIGAILLGWQIAALNDDGTASPAKSAKLAIGNFVIEQLAVSGLGGTAADIGKKVYATDDGTYSVTDNTTHQVHVGHVSRYRTSSVADVLMVPSIFGTVGV